MKRARLISAWMFLGAITLAPIARAAWPVNPAINVPIDASPGEQFTSYLQPMIPDGVGGFLVCWQDSNATGYDIRAHHMLASGVPDPAWPAGGVMVCDAPNDQTFSSLVSDGNGGAILCWDDLRNGVDADIYAHHVLASGVVDPAWPAQGRAICTATNHQGVSTLVPDGLGGAFIAWQDNRTGATSANVYVQRVLASGAIDPQWPAQGLAICVSPFIQRFPSLVVDGPGSAIVLWSDQRNGTDDDVFAQRVRFNGTFDPAWPACGRLVSTAPFNQLFPLAVSDGLGGAIVTWQDRRNGVNTDFYAHHILSGGGLDPSWTANGSAVCALAGNQARPQICSDGSGGAYVTGHDQRSGFDSGVFMHHLLSSGVDPSWPANGTQLCASTGEVPMGTLTIRGLASDGAGGVVATWSDRRSGNEDIYAGRVRLDGTVDPNWPVNGLPVCTAPQTQGGAFAIADGLGNTLLVWSDDRSGTSTDVYAQRVLGSGSLGVAFVPVASGLPAIKDGDVAWADYDLDGDLDLLMAGVDCNGARRCILMRNDAGTFVDSGIGFPGIQYASVDWGDYDNDGDPDIALAGRVSGFTLFTTRIFRNDGGAFVDLAAGLPGVQRGVVAWADYDNDSDLDLLVAGGISLIGSDCIARLYRNDAGTFVDAQAGLTGVTSCSADWGDYDADGDFDLALTGHDGVAPRTRIYRNDGGALVEALMAFQNVSSGVIAFADRDADSDLDLLLAGYDGANGWCKVLDNNGDTFVSVGTALPGISSGPGDWGDFDNDGDPDFVVTGLEAGLCVSRIHRNDGGQYPNAGFPIVAAYIGGAAWGDYDGDGDLDLIVTGQSCEFACVVQLYRNDWALPNLPPAPPMSPLAVRDGDDVNFSWQPPVDDHTPAAGLSYELTVSPSPGGAPLSRATQAAAGPDGATGVGEITGRTSWTLTVPPGNFAWSVRAIDGAKRSSAPAGATTVGVDEPKSSGRTGLRAIVPNPFMHSAAISYTLPSAGRVRLTVNDLQGRRVRILVDGERPSGVHHVHWDGSSDDGAAQPAGIYWARLEASGQVWTTKLVRVTR